MGMPAVTHSLDRPSVQLMLVADRAGLQDRVQLERCDAQAGRD